MNLTRPDDSTLVMRNIPAEVAEIIRGIPLTNETCSEAAEARMYPSPTSREGEEDLCSDWSAHVQPGLYEAFQEARETVAADLRGLNKEGKGFSLSLPVRHLPAWLNALNQARLALAATHNFSEEELSRRPSLKIASPRQLARLQLDVLAAIQEWFVEVLDEDS